MTDDQIKQWKYERDMARAIHNKEDRDKALRKCYDNRDDMMMTCIAHQGDRVKHIMKDHNDMVMSHKEYQEELLKRKLQEKNVNKIMTIIKYAATIIGSTGLGAVVMKWIGG